MHFPLGLRVFSFATLGAVIALRIYIDRLLWAYLAVFASLCLASYSFDESNGLSLRTTIPGRQLKILGWSGLAASVLTGVYLATNTSLGKLFFPDTDHIVFGIICRSVNYRLQFAIWNLNHEFRVELNTIREIASRSNGRLLPADGLCFVEYGA